MRRSSARVRRVVGLAAWGLLLCWLAATPGAARAAAAGLKVFPDRVEIGTFFQGTQVRVQGDLPRGAQAVVEVRGQSVDEALLRKGRRGFLWMNVGEVQARGAPCLCLVAATDPKLLSSPAGGQPWGYDALKKQISFGDGLSAGDRDILFGQFMQLKESEGLYQASAASLKMRTTRRGTPAVEGSFWLPGRVAPGTYQVVLWVVQDGAVVDKRAVDLEVAKVGFPAVLSTLAYEHGALYGFLAVGIAVLTGFAMGFLFKGGGGH